MGRKKTITPARLVYDKAIKDLGYKHLDVMRIIDRNDVGFLSYPSLLMLLRRGTCNPYYPRIIESVLNIEDGKFVEACSETRLMYQVVVDVTDEESSKDVVDVCID
jgi:hypothetical protein